ncbi:AmpG family muropeptide MFS transporter [Seongchinamella unica]|uniref:AmpG family muropeptide MFS transporter n=1 Tax=Seongchinamella unica TaxID=2547392 RepID=UPI0030842926
MVEGKGDWRASVFNRRMLICVFTGFASGMPLYVLFQLVPAWLRDGGVSLVEIGLFALVGIPYTWKFAWAPLMDRWVPPFLGRRRGWMLIFQVALLLSIAGLGAFVPARDTAVIAWIAFAVAFFSASQDVALDAYRREILPDEELGLGNSIHVQAYRISSLVPGSLSLILADHLPWNSVFWITGGFMLVGVVMTLLVAEPDTEYPQAAGLREAVVAPFREYLQRRGWQGVLLVLGFMFLYKIGDNMATALATPFYLDLGFSMTEIGAVAKHAALWPAIIGGLLGGGLMIRLGINRALWLFGVVQVVSILGFAVLAQVGHSLWLLATVISFEYLGVGMGTAAFTAFIARETSRVYAAAQFALFTALAALPRTFANASTGIIVEQVGWVQFFLLCAVLAIPGMLMLFWVAPWRERPAAVARASTGPRTVILHGGMHKTGSSAIQDYLYQHLDDPAIEYFSAGRANSSLTLLEAFHTRLGRLPGYRGKNLSEQQLVGKQQQALTQFRRRLRETTKPTVILSAESFSLLNHQECASLAAELSEYFTEIRLVLYIRPLHSRVESAFQEKLKQRFIPLDHKIVVNFKRRIDIYDEIFGRDNVIIRAYDRALFPGGSVINDFLEVAGVTAKAPVTARSNVGMSLPAVQLLYTYRTYFPRAEPGDRELVDRLTTLPGESFRLHPTLLRKIVVERDAASYEWLQERANISLHEETHREGLQVASEQELLNVTISTLEWLEEQTGGLVVASAKPGPGEIAIAMKTWSTTLRDSGVS